MWPEACEQGHSHHKVAQGQIPSGPWPSGRSSDFISSAAKSSRPVWVSDSGFCFEILALAVEWRVGVGDKTGGPGTSEGLVPSWGD